jgi:hypothetical protein
LLGQRLVHVPPRVLAHRLQLILINSGPFAQIAGRSDI